MNKQEIGKNVQIILDELKRYETFSKFDVKVGNYNSTQRIVNGSRKILKLFYPFTKIVLTNTLNNTKLEKEFFENYKIKTHKILEKDYDLNLEKILISLNKIEILFNEKQY